jgi:outer membrane receptor for ferric coprogen and ferric-rhodotorulic acid
MMANTKRRAAGRPMLTRAKASKLKYAPTVFAGTAIAALPQPQALAADGEVLNEIVVVARHYRPDQQTSATGLEMQLIDTPQAISVITPEMLQVAGATSIYDATDLVPGLRRSGTGFGLDRFMLRGNLLQEHRINGTDFSIWHSLEDYAFDRILKSPKKDFEAEIGFRGGQWDLKEWQMDVTGSVPGTDDKLSARFVGLYRDSGTWVDPSIIHIHDNKNMVMGALQYDFTDATVAHLWFYDDEAHMDPLDGGSLQSLPDGTLTFPNVNPADWFFGDARYDKNTITNMFIVADVLHTFPNSWKMKAQATLAKSKNKMSEYFVFGPAGAYSLGDNDVYLYSYDQIQEAEDATFDMSLNGKFSVLGREQQFFAAFEGQGDVRPTKNTLFNSIYLGAINIAQGGRGILSDGTPVPLIDKSALTVRNQDEGRFRDYRLSLQLLANPIDRVRILAGVLGQHTVVNDRRLIDGSVLVADPAYDRTVYTEAVKRGGITYDLFGKHGWMDAMKTYFNYSEGFNPNIGAVDQNGHPLTAPQLMKQYEWGVKSEFLNGAAGSSLAVYTSRIENQPVQANYLGGFGAAGEVLEGVQRVKGVEYEMVGEFLQGWNIAFNYAYTFTEIADPNYSFRIPVKSVPHNAGALYSSYEFTRGPIRGLRLGFDVAMSSNYSFDPTLGNVAKFGQYMGGGGTRLDFNFSYRFQESLHGLEVYANAINVTNKYTFLTKEDHPGFGITRDEPKQFTFGIRYKYK